MKTGITNIIIGKPLVNWWELCCTQNPSAKEIMSEHEMTFFTDERIPAKILKEFGLVNSINEVRRNKPELCQSLATPDCFWLKWGKNKFWVVVGE